MAQERIERDVHEIRVAEIALPVGERKLEGLCDRVEVRIRAVPLLALTPAASAMESASSRNGPWHHAPQV